MERVDDILNDLESLTTLFTEYKQLKGKFPVPLKCLYAVVVEKINRIEAHMREIKMVTRNNTYEMDFEGVEIAVEYYIEPAQRGFRDSYGAPLEPDYDASLEVESVYVGQDMVDITNILSDKQIEYIRNQIEEYLSSQEPEVDDDRY